jgi:opine dehydrogenase
VQDRPVFCVMGAGHGGLAMAGHLGLMGFEVRLFNRTSARLEAIRERGGIQLSGELSGFGKVTLATDCAAEALEGADVVMVVVPATAHRFMAQACAPHLRDGQVIVLAPGRTLGALEFRQVLTRLGCEADVTIAETQTFLYASRVTGPGQARVFAVKNFIPLATLEAHRIPACLAVVRKAFPQFIPGDNVLKTGFNNIGTVFHPALMVLNAGWVEDPIDFEFYYQGTSASVSRVLERLDAERVAVAAAIGIRGMTAREWLYFAYDAVGKTILEAVHANPGYRGILAPHRMAMRYLTEDVPCGLVPMSSIGRRFGVSTPTMDSIIHMASTLLDRDFCKEGRTVESLGLGEMDIRQMRLLAIGEGR